MTPQITLFSKSPLTRFSKLPKIGGVYEIHVNFKSPLISPKEDLKIT
jgi:hypothetical protein